MKAPSISLPLHWGLLALGAIAVCLLQAGLFQQNLFNWDGFPLLWRFFRASLRPDLDAEFIQLTLNATIVTFAYAVCGTFLSVIIGAIGGLICSEVWWSDILRIKTKLPIFSTVRAVLAIPRAIHEMIWGLFFVNIWGLDPLTAIVAIAIPFGAITAKIFSEILDETPRSPLHALINSGIAPLSAFIYTLLPQAFLNLLSYGFYRFECSIRSAAVLGIIGAGGLGYEILLSLQSLKYEQLWTLFYALFILNGCVDVASAWLRDRFGCAKRLDLTLKKHPSQLQSAWNQYQDGSHSRSRQTPRYASLKSLLITTGIIGSTVVFCFQYIHPEWSRLWSSRTIQLFDQVMQSMFPPDFSGIATLIPLSVDTIAMSVIAIALAALGGLLFGFAAARNVTGSNNLTHSHQHSILSQSRLLIARATLLIARAIPAPIWALVVLFVLFPGILPGAIALGLHNFGILGRLFAEVVENLEQPPLEALRAQGTPNSLVFLYGVLPLTIPRFLSYTLYRWEVCMRETVIVGLVGAGGLGRSLTEQLSSFDYRSLMVTLGAFLVLTFAVDWISAMARRSLR